MMLHAWATMRSSYSALSLPSLPVSTSHTTTATPTLIKAWNNKKTTPAIASSCPPLHTRKLLQCGRCSARRRVRYDDDDDDDEEEAYGHNAEIAVLESYTESVRSKALLVRATVDGEEEVVLVFKGFSSCLSGRTSPDPSRSVLPAKAVIESIDVIKGPFDPSNIEYLEKGLAWEDFKKRLQLNTQF